jgi:hypothetical protein
VPLTVQPGDEHARDEEHAHRDDQQARDLVQQFAVFAQRLADTGGGEAEEDEDRREGGDEKQAWDQHPPPRAALELAGLDAGDRREVSGHERQHAR